MNQRRSTLSKVFRALEVKASQILAQKVEPEDTLEGDSWEPPEYDYNHFIQWAKEGPLHNVMSVDVELDYLYKFQEDLSLSELIEVLSTLEENPEFLLLAREEPALWEWLYGLWECVEKRVQIAVPPSFPNLFTFNEGKRYRAVQAGDAREIEPLETLWKGVTLC